MNLKIILYTLVFLSIIASCKEEKSNNNNDTVKKENINPADFLPTHTAIKVADSIMYITNVKNPDPEAEYYMQQWLGGSNTKLLADKIFDAVYKGQLKAYDYMSGEEMNIDEIKALEKEHKREDIGQILFTEDWYFDEKGIKMYKQVNSVMLAYFRYNENGELLGNKAGIRVYFNGTKPMRGAMDY